MKLIKVGIALLIWFLLINITLAADNLTEDDLIDPLDNYNLPSPFKPLVPHLKI